MHKISMDALNTGWSIGFGTKIVARASEPDDLSWELALLTPRAAAPAKAVATRPSIDLASKVADLFFTFGTRAAH